MIDVALDELHVFLVEDGEQHWVSAASRKDALQQHVETYGCTVREYLADCYPDVPTVEQLADGDLLAVRMNEEPGEPTIEKTCRDWASEGRGQIASTCY